MSQPTVRRGALIFKGEKPLSQRPKKVKSSSAHASTSSGIQTIHGEGRVVSNGTTIQGMETRFKDEVEVGDIIVVRHPQSLLIEERIVVNVISQRSLNINSPFSSDFVSTTEFSVRKESEKLKPKLVPANGIKKEELVDGEEEVAVGGAQASIQDELERKIAQEKSVLTYQQKVGPWGYRPVAEKLDRHYSEEELLDLRCKKVHDKYC